MKSTNKVRAFSLLLAVCVLLSVFTAGVSAVSGTEGNARWEIKDGVLTVYGGDLPDHTASTAPAYALLSGKVRRIVVGEGVSYIGERSFEDMTAVTRVEIGEGVTSIGKMAFSGCSSLEGVTLPSSVTSIGDFAFAECLSLKTVSLSRGLAELGEGVFELTPSLRSITSDGERYVTKNGILCDTVKSSVYRFPSASIATSVTLEGWVTAVERGAFRDAAGLTGVNMPSVTDIGEGAFYGCSSLENIKMPMAKTIGMASFYGCGMQEMYLPASLESIGDSAFAFCQRLTTADFAGNAPAAEDGIFYGADPTFMILADPSCTGFGNEKWLSYPVMYHNIYGGEADGIVWTLNSRTGEFTATGNGGAIPDYESPADAPWYLYRKLCRSISLENITAIGNNAFRYFSVRSLVLSDEVKYVGAYAFSGCSFLTDVRVDGECVIGKGAFFVSTELSEVRLPHVTEIGAHAFSGCDELYMAVLPEKAPVLGEYAFDGTSAAVLYPMGGTGYDDPSFSDVYTEEYIPGDVDGDGICNIGDVTHLLKYIAGWNDISLRRYSADVNTDRKNDINDVLDILKYIAQWDIVMGISL